MQKQPRDKHLLIPPWDWGKGTGCPEAGKAKLNSFYNFITKEIYWPQEHFAHQIELKTKDRAVFAGSLWGWSPINRCQQREGTSVGQERANPAWLPRTRSGGSATNRVR